MSSGKERDEAVSSGSGRIDSARVERSQQSSAPSDNGKVDIAKLGREFASEYVPSDAMSITEADAIWEKIFNNLGIGSNTNRVTFSAKWAMIVAVNTTSSLQSFDRQLIKVGGMTWTVSSLFGNKAGDLTRDNYRRFWRSEKNVSIVQDVIAGSPDVQSLLKSISRRQGIYTDHWRVSCDICDRFTDLSTGELAEIQRLSAVKQLKSNTVFVAGHVPVGSVSGGDVYEATSSSGRTNPPAPTSFNS